MRVALFGSPSFVLPALEALRLEHDLVLVVAQPDKPAGRGKRLTPPAVAARARELGLRLEQPVRLKRDEAFLGCVKELDLDVAITAAYGKILSQALLDLPRHGFLNVHASLLPKYRGAAPIQWALINGERETGISIMQTEAGLDTGPIRLVKRLELHSDDTAPALFERLSTLGAEALSEALERLGAGTLPLCPQDDAKATHAPLLSKEDGLIRWESSAAGLYNRYRGVYAWPGSHTIFGGKGLKVLELRPVAAKGGKPGEIVARTPEGLTVACGEGALLLRTVQPPGKSKMSAYDWANGYGIKPGAFLGAAGG